MRVIGFTGESPVDGKHAGKDTAAGFLAEYLRDEGKTVRLGAWADKLKVSAARALGFEGTEQECVAYCDWLKEHGHVVIAYDGIEPPGDVVLSETGRQFLEKLGTEGGRDVHGQNVWVDLALPAPAIDLKGKPTEFGKPGPGWEDVDVYLDTTTRFPNEVERIRDWAGWVVRIERPGVENPPGGHVSKYGIPRDQCDAVVINDGTLDDLRDRIVYAYITLERGRYEGHPFVVADIGSMLA